MDQVRGIYENDPPRRIILLRIQRDESVYQGQVFQKERDSRGRVCNKLRDRRTNINRGVEDKMSLLVLRAICDGDECSKLGSVAYSTNPRAYVTIEQMVIAYENTK